MFPRLRRGFSRRGSVKVVLKKDVKGLGKAGEVKNVSDGYARNYLIPRGLAVEATEGEIRKLQNELKVKMEKEMRVRKKSEDLLNRLKRRVHEVQVKAGEKGKLFGSLTSSNLAEALSKALGERIDKKWVNLKKPIKEIGEYEIELKLPGGVRGKVKVRIIPEGEGR